MINISRRTFIKQSGILANWFVMPFGIYPMVNKKELKSKMHYDVIIIGGSYSGLAASMALGRALRRVLIIDSGKPCNRQTPHSHNFLTNDGKTPMEISTQAKLQVSAYKTVEFQNDLAIKSQKAENGFEIQTASGALYQASKLIFATGIRDIVPNINGFSESWGISVLHCPYCHGYEVRNESTGILGNGDYGFEFSKLISNWTKDLTLFTNGNSTLTIDQKSILERNQITIEEKEIKEFEQTKGYLKSIIFSDLTKTHVKAIYTSLPFEQHCQIPKQLGCELSEEGYIKIDSTHKTTINGIYACGDNVTRMRTVANAVSMGTTTGMMVNKALIEEKFLRK